MLLLERTESLEECSETQDTLRKKTEELRQEIKCMNVEMNQAQEIINDQYYRIEEQAKKI